MLTSYIDDDGRLRPVDPAAEPGALQRGAWLDLVDPTEDERARVASLFKERLPETEDVEEIEATARSFVDDDGLHLTSLFLHTADGRPRNTSWPSP